MKIRLLAVVACLLMATGASLAASLPAGVEVSYELSKQEFNASEPLMLKVTYTNVTSTAITMLKWGTALEGRINEDFLDIRLSGQRLAYNGRHYKRAPAQASDHVLLLPGQSLSSSVDILSAYKVDKKGNYQIAESAPNGGSAKASPIGFSLDADRVVVAAKVASVYENCSASQASLISSALSVAEVYSRRARDDLRNTPVSERTNAQRYKKWFGTYSTANWNRVQDHFNRIYSATSGKTIGFDCGCSDSSFAFVYTNDHYNMTLCNAFWSAPTSGTDSKAGTIIHEISHFDVSSSEPQGTRDHAYSHGPSSRLAIQNPTLASKNADSHEYFAENTPSLSMPSASLTPTPVPEPEPEPNIIQHLLLLLLD